MMMMMTSVTHVATLCDDGDDDLTKRPLCVAMMVLVISNE